MKKFKAVILTILITALCTSCAIAESNPALLKLRDMENEGEELTLIDELVEVYLQLQLGNYFNWGYFGR